MKNPWVIVGVLLVVLIGGSVWYSNVAAERNNEGIILEPHISGNPDATVELIEFSDLQCPACAAFQPYVNEVLAEYGDSVRFEYRHFPLPMHPMAEPAARAAEAAGQQGAFFEFVDLVFSEQATWSKSANPAAAFIQYADTLELDIDQFKRQMNASMLRERINANKQDGLERGVTGTPTFFLNGEKMQINTYDDFKNQIVAAINPQADLGAEGEEGMTEPELEVKFGI